MKHHVAYLKKTNPVQEIVEKVPDFKKFGRAAKLQLNPDKVPNLKWKYEEMEIAQMTEADPYKQTQEIAEILILHLCFRYICSTVKQRNLKNLIRCYKVVKCLNEGHEQSTKQ